MSEELKRAVRMMEVACSFIENNCPFGTTHYDGTECDGFCLSEDLSSASEDLQNAWNTRSDLAVEVKPLEWDGFSAPPYFIEVENSGIAKLYNTMDYDEDGVLEPMQGGYLTLLSIDDLKATAQADHNARVRSELILRPDDLRPKLQSLVTKWEGMTCRTKCAEELREVLEGGE